MPHPFTKNISRLLLFLLLLPLSALSASFSDVPETHPQYAAIESLKNLEIIKGHPNGTFAPDDLVNRAEAIKMILLSAEISVDEYDTSAPTGFTDVSPSAWFTKFVTHARSLNIVKGNPDGSFAPARNVNKAEFIKMLTEAFSVDLSKHQNPPTLATDAPADAWFAPYFSYAKTVGLISPTLDNRLQPDQFLTRSQCAEIIYRLLLIHRGGDTQKMLSIAESSIVDLFIALKQNNPSLALQKADNAIFYTEQALSANPDEPVVKSANLIAQAFRSLCLAYQAGAQSNPEGVRTNVAEARRLADEALATGASTDLHQRVHTISDTLLSQLD